MIPDSSLLVTVLVRETVLLALAWAAHALLRKKHPRSRRILWRGVHCLVLLLPLALLNPITILRLPVYPSAAQHSVLAAMGPADTRASLAQPQPASAQSAPAAVPQPLPRPERSSAGRSFPWEMALIITWGAGALFTGTRLLGLQLQLNRLRRKALPADAALRQRAQEMQRVLGVRGHIRLLISDSISSSFVCGLFKPALLVPQRLLGELPDEELTALMAHELAHFRGKDLFWCVAWRWMQVVLWFHPLVWAIPAAHNLACEQEADRIASGQVANGPAYSQLLARLTLRILAMPEVETRLALNGTSQIARRLKHLQGESGRWGWPQSAGVLATLSLVFLITAGSQLSQASPPVPTVPGSVNFKTVLATVQDAGGRPVSGVSIKPTGFRVKGMHGADAYSWPMNHSGPAEEVTTDQNGQAYLKYPVMGIPEEKELTGALILMVTHPEYVSRHIQDFAVDGTNQPIRMTRGIPLEVSGYFGNDRRPVTEIVPNINERTIPVKLADWQKHPGGSLTFSRLSPGGHLLMLMGRLPSGEVVYSDTLAFTAETNRAYQYALELKPGIRLEGQLDERVPRPVHNARVMISVRPEQYPSRLVIEDFYALYEKYGGHAHWHSYRPIAEDGTFVFESLPPGEADITALGEGFASKTVGTLQNRFQGGLQENSGMAIPQTCPLVAPVTRVQIATEATARLELTTVTKKGAPIEGVWAGLFVSAFRMIHQFGYYKVSSEEPFRMIPPLPDLDFSGRTDKHGKLVLHDFPAEGHGLSVSHPKYQAPLQDPKGWRDRHLRLTYAPGQTNSLKLVMEPVGSSFIGR